MPADLQVDDLVTVFIYKDNEDRLIATTQECWSMLASFLFRSQSNQLFWCISIYRFWQRPIGTFERATAKMVEGGKYFVYTYIDEQTQRLTGTAKIDESQRK